MEIREQIKVLVATAKQYQADFWDLYEPAVYVGKNEEGWFAEVWCFDKNGKPGMNNHKLGVFNKFQKRAQVCVHVLAELKKGGVIYPNNQVVNLGKD